MAAKKPPGRFRVDWKTEEQKLAYDLFQQHDVLILSGLAGTGKTHLAMAMAISDILTNKREKIVMTRPIVEAGESLGFLPGDLKEKVNPYMVPMYDVMTNMVGAEGDQRSKVNGALETVPLAYMRGRTFNNAVCIFDECQNATLSQIKLFMTRLGDNSKMILTGDPKQSDLKDSGFQTAIDKLSNVSGIAVVTMGEKAIIRHRIIASVLKALGD